MCVQHSLSLHFYLLHWLLNSYDRNDAILTSLYAHKTVLLLQQETSDFFSPESGFVAAKQSGPKASSLPNLTTDAEMCRRHPSAIPAT